MNAHESLPLKGKKLLILDGSQKAVEIIIHAKRLGLHVSVTDYNDPTDSPAKLAADEHFAVSTADIDAVVKLIRTERIDGVVTGFSDRWLPTYAEICDRANLPSYASADQLRLFTNKSRYKELLIKHGVPTVEGYNLEQAISGAIPVDRFPLILKPTDGSGSRGVIICKHPSELQPSIATALKHSRAGQLVIERYLPLEEATVHWLFQNGDYHVTMMANRHMRSFRNGTIRLPVAYSTPSHILPGYLRDVAPRVKEMLAAAGVSNGMMFMQGVVDDGIFRTYDIGFRITPTQEYRIIEALRGYNPLLLFLTFAVTGDMGARISSATTDPFFDKYGFNVSTLAAPGTVATFHGIDEVRSWSRVLACSPALLEGTELPQEAIGQLRQIVVRTVGTADSPEQLERTVMRIGDVLDVIDAKGRSIVLPGLCPGELQDKLL